jgi:hypothetical protein
MAYIRKTEDVWVLQGNYYGEWEDLTAEITRKEIQERKKEYRENQPGVALRTRLKRIKK